MRLSELVAGYAFSENPTDPEITGITEDSRRVEPGNLFVAVPGTAQDGHAYVDEAIARGAAAIIVERRDDFRLKAEATSGAAEATSNLAEATSDTKVAEGAAMNGTRPRMAPQTVLTPRRVPVLVANSSRLALAEVAARFYDHPARDLQLIGFTGTFGKTTTSDVLRRLLETGGARAGVLGSLGARYAGFHEAVGSLTTPAPVELHRALRQLRDAGADTAIMEVTTHGLRLDRVAGLRFAHGVLAAIRPGEHTDFHRTYEDYVSAKRRFVEFLDPDGVLAYDADNRAARTIAATARVRAAAALSIGRQPPRGPHDVTVTDVELDQAGALMTVRGHRLRSSLLGRTNVRNVGLALTLALALGLDVALTRDVLAALQPLPRRMERLTMAGRTVLNDTAGHPESLHNTFEAAEFLQHGTLMAAYALRGNRGEDINRRNATSVADLAALHAVQPLIVTAAADVTGPANAASAAEIDATRRALRDRGARYIWHETLAEAMADVARQSSAGDLIVLVGAPGMDEGAGLLREALEC